jgi:hypothetical protein
VNLLLIFEQCKYTTKNIGLGILLQGVSVKRYRTNTLLLGLSRDKPDLQIL